MDESARSKEITLNSLQISLVLEADRAQKTTNNYVDELRKRKWGLDKELERLSKESKMARQESDEIQSLIEITLTKANKSYEKAIGSMIHSLGVTMPSQSSLRYDDRGNPVSLVVLNSDDNPTKP